MKTNSAYDKIRDIIISRLEAAKKAAEDGDGENFHWIKPWSGSGLPLNVSYATEEAYQGINQVLLYLSAHGTDEWLTFPAIKKFHEKDSRVKLRKGAKGQNIIYFDSYIKKDKDGQPVEVDEDGNPIPRYFAKTYFVFSVEDVEGLDRHTCKTRYYEHDESTDINRLESILAYYYKAAGIELEVVDGGNRAFFSPSKNVIRVPDKSNFKTVASYAHTLAHETIHSTGKALGRDMSGAFGGKSYSAEELVADIGADFITNRLHIIEDSVDDEELANSIAYIDSWLSELRSTDTKINICKAAADAQKAADYIYDTAIQQMKEEMQVSREAVLQLESGVCIYIEDIGNGSFAYYFCEADGTIIASGIYEPTDETANLYDAITALLKENEMDAEEAWLLPVQSFKERMEQLIEGRNDDYER